MQALMAIVGSRVPLEPLRLVRTVVGVAAGVDGLITWNTLSRLGQPGILALPIVTVPRLPSDWVSAIVVLWVATAIAFAFGWAIRFTGPVLLGVMGYVLLLDQQTYSNHLYLLVLVVGLVTAALWRTRDGEAPGWPVFLLKVQLTVAYGFASVSKLNPAFVSGAVIYVNLREPLLRAPGLVSFPALVTVAALSIATELFLACGLWSPRWRRTAAMVGVLFHSSLILSMDDPTGVGLALFGSVCVSLYALFFDLRPQPLTVYFDDECGLCSVLIRRVQCADRYRLVEPVSNRHRLASGSTSNAERTIVVVDHLGNTLTRSRGIAAMAGALPWPYMALRLLSWPGIESISNAVYDLVARNRGRLSIWLGLHACALPRNGSIGGSEGASASSRKVGGA